MIAAIATGDPTGIAAAYDKYAAVLYAYCQWMLNQPADAAEALRDTFVVAATTIGDFAEDVGLRPQLYAVARDECQRRHHGTIPIPDGHAEGVSGPTARAALPDVRGDLKPTELLALIRGILAELPSREREAVELSLRHNLHDADLAHALGISWSRAHALTERARGRLERALGTLLIARTGREACTELGRLLADWDGRLTGEARDLIAGHVEQCQTCSARRLGAMRPAALSGLMPLTPLPPELREQVLRLCSAATEDAQASQPQATWRAESVWHARFSRLTRLLGWTSTEGHRRPAAATVVLAAWITLVFATGITLLLTGSHPSHALAATPSLRLSSSSPAAVANAASAPAIISPSPLASPTPTPTPSPTISQAQAIVPSPVESPSFVEPSPSPSTSRSPKPSKSPSPKPSKSPSPTPSKSRSPSPSPSGSSSPSASTTG